MNRTQSSVDIPEALALDIWATGNDVKVYAVLAARASRRSRLAPLETELSVTEVCELSGLNFDTAKRALRRLVAARWIARVQRGSAGAVTTLNPDAR